MNTRTRNPAVGTAKASVSRYDTSSDRYITTDSARYGTTEVARSRRLRSRRGRAYGASTSCHDATSWTVGAAANELTYSSLLSTHSILWSASGRVALSPLTLVFV